eukprot:TRINITY_DN523_c0_g1_i1.p1 TRINITY_DN523_c0_g1~~TRINITY_DN523_c0_g1_i1.p1  ORF type:complete len:50 (-),score=2.39 TRINITY_DN523_c0_g1_i1:21-170(-)
MLEVDPFQSSFYIVCFHQSNYYRKPKFQVLHTPLLHLQSIWDNGGLPQA